jgi:D-threo-aldose 1-dehydrogenase
MSQKTVNKLNSLGKTGIEVSPVGLGGAPLGHSAFSPLTDEEVVNVVQASLHQGIRLFDTAPSYGNGESERRLGQALKGIPRQNFILETKIGLIREGRILRYNLPVGSVRQSMEESLKRLQLDYIDILLIHDPDRFYQNAIEVVYPELWELRRQGIVRAIGVGMNQWEMLSQFKNDAIFDVFMLAHRYTLLEHSSLEFLDDCLHRGIAIHLAGVFNSGILATGAVEKASFFYADAPDDICDQVSKIQKICARYNIPISAVALQFAWAHPAVTSLVIGMSYPEEVFDNLGALSYPIPDELWQELIYEELIAANVPVPGKDDPG